MYFFHFFRLEIIVSLLFSKHTEFSMTPWRSNCSSAGDGMYTMGAMGYPQQYLWKRAWLGTMKLDDVLAGKNIDQGLAKQWYLYTYNPHNYQIEWYIRFRIWAYIFSFIYICIRVIEIHCYVFKDWMSNASSDIWTFVPMPWRGESV